MPGCNSKGQLRKVGSDAPVQKTVGGPTCVSRPCREQLIRLPPKMAVAMCLQLGNQVTQEQTMSFCYQRCYQNSYRSSPLQGRATQQSQQVFPLRHKGTRGDVLPCPSRAFLSLSYQNSGVKVTFYYSAPYLTQQMRDPRSREVRCSDPTHYKQLFRPKQTPNPFWRKASAHVRDTGTNRRCWEEGAGMAESQNASCSFTRPLVHAADRQRPEPCPPAAHRQRGSGELGTG